MVGKNIHQLVTPPYGPIDAVDGPKGSQIGGSVDNITRVTSYSTVAFVNSRTIGDNPSTHECLTCPRGQLWKKLTDELFVVGMATTMFPW